MNQRANLQRQLSAYPLGVMLWRLTEEFERSVVVRHQLLRHWLTDDYDGATIERTEGYFKGFPPCWAMVYNCVVLRNEALGYQAYINKQLNQLEDEANPLLDLGQVWSMGALTAAAAVDEDGELCEAVSKLIKKLAVSQLHFNVQMAGELVLNALRWHDVPPEWEVQITEAFLTEWQWVQGLAYGGGKGALMTACKRYGEFIMSRTDNESYARAARFWSGPVRRRLTAALLTGGRVEGVTLEQLLDHTYEVENEIALPPPPVPDPTKEDDWQVVGGVLAPRPRT